MIRKIRDFIGMYSTVDKQLAYNDGLEMAI